MKKTFFSLALATVCLQGQAQSSKFEKAVALNVATLDTTTKAAGFQKLAASFERIATAEKTQWLPYYYASYCVIRAVRQETNLNLIDAKLDKAEDLAQKANALSPKNSEVYCLNALVAFSRINVDFMARGSKYSALANEALVTAQKLDPNNPRPYLLIGQSKYSTPEQFGGDKKLGCQYLSKAHALFTAATASATYPHWGKADAAHGAAACTAPAAAASTSTPKN
jgi:hypothetical protein